MKRLDDEVFLLWDTTTSVKTRLKCNIIDLMEIPCGSLVELTGDIDENGICVETVKVIHRPLRAETSCIEAIPLDPVEYTMKYPLFARHPDVMRRIIVYSLIVDSMRTFLKKRGFLELPSVVIGHASDPGLRGASKIAIELYGKTYELQSSVIMYKQIYASVFEKIFYVARNIREEPLENAYTGRHLVEFTQVDVEAANADKESMIKLAEIAIYKSINQVIDRHADLLDYDVIETLEKEITKPPYPRLTYDQAIEEASRMGLHVKKGLELSFEAETAIANKYGVPVWITSFPTESRGFYYIEEQGRPGYNVDYNLLLPRHGEVLDGGCREYRYDQLVDKITKRHREKLDKYKWFLELSRAGLIRPTCGWGVGVERLVKYIFNLDHIAYASPHPRIPGYIGP